MAWPTIFCTLVGLLILAVGQELPRDKQHYIDTNVAKLMECADIPSLSISYINLDKQFRHSKGYGKHGQYNRQVVANSVFCVGGATQAFTAVLLAKLLDVNKTFTWDTPIQEIVGHQLALPSRFISRNLNLKDILAMRSGLAGMEIVPVAKPFSQEKLVMNLHYAPRVASFRDRFIYNEVLFSLLEEVVAKLGGDTWSNLISRHILQPLGMRSTIFAGGQTSSNLEFVRGVVYSNNMKHYLEDDTYSGLELVAPAASLCTTADDMVKWLQFLTDRQRGNTVNIRREALEATFVAAQSRGQGDPVNQEYQNYLSYTRDSNSLGWINGFYQGNPFVSQDGSLPGYQSLATIIPAKNVAVFVALSGGHDDDRYAAKVLINAIVIDQLLQNSTVRFPTFPTNMICSTWETLSRSNLKIRKEDRYTYNKAVTSSRPLEDYTGLFSNYAYGDIHVKYNASHENTLSLEYGMATYKLEPFNNNTFQLQAQTRSLWYSTSADWYRDKERIFAEFSFRVNERDERIVTVKIDGFDKNYIPEFSTHAVVPYYDDVDGDQRCSAPALIACQCFILLLSTLVTFR